MTASAWIEIRRCRRCNALFALTSAAGNDIATIVDSSQCPACRAGKTPQQQKPQAVKTLLPADKQP